MARTRTTIEIRRFGDDALSADTGDPTTRYVALVSAGVVPDQHNLRNLARLMAGSGADVGLGALRLSGGRRVLRCPGSKT